MRGATKSLSSFFVPSLISTHTPHAGRDTIGSCCLSEFKNFYSHAPCGARLSSAIQDEERAGFLLTRPMRGATLANFSSASLSLNFYSHAPCGARLAEAMQTFSQFDISTHTPHAGRDRSNHGRVLEYVHFYSHAPCGARLTEA